MTATLLGEELDALDDEVPPPETGAGLDGPVTGGTSTVTPVDVWPDAASAVLSALLDERAMPALAAAEGLVVTTVTWRIADTVGVLAVAVDAVADPTAAAMLLDWRAVDTVCATLVLEPRPDTVTGTVTEASNFRRPLLLGVPTVVEVPPGKRLEIAAASPAVEIEVPLEVRVNVVLTGRSVTTTFTDEAATPATPATLPATALGENVARLMAPSCSVVLTLLAASGGGGL